MSALGRAAAEAGQALGAGPAGGRLETNLWTCPRVAEVIQKHFGVTYHASHVWKVLRSLGWTPQKPERRARERDEQAIAGWRNRDWPRLKKVAHRHHPLVFLDESGFMLQPLLRRTWAPQGETPLSHAWDRHDRLSVISA